MAVRIRKDCETILCAAKSKEMEGDCYLDDSVHYTLAVDMKILHTEPPYPDERAAHHCDENGAEYWHFDTVNGERKYKENIQRSLSFNG